MKTVTVNVSASYDIHIDSGLLSRVAEYVQALGKVRTVCIVSDTNVFPLYGKQVAEKLENEGFRVVSYVFPAGEASKNAETFLELLNFLAENQLTRTDLIAALGGGVVGDLAGFAAACYLRGIRFVQLPTTLLAAVDSSVGGKTAIDLPAGKNLAGAFYHPSLVLCDTDTLQTLPEDTFRDGCAEVIKYAVLFDPELFSTLTTQGLDFDREAVISRCIGWKKWVVEQDAYDTGLRRKLNLGHTIGHALELRSNFALSHGKSVAIGMAVVARAAASAQLCDCRTRDSILSLLIRFSLPVTTREAVCDIAKCALSDKKRTGDILHLIVPKAIGNCEILPLPVSGLQSFLEAGLTAESHSDSSDR